MSARSVLTDREVTITTYTRDPAGRLLAAHAPEGPRYMLTDGLGSVMGLADDEGSPVASYRYSPFGELLEAAGPEAKMCRCRVCSLGPG